MMARQQINRMIRILGKPRVPLLVKDTDGDGVMNGLDCQPRNPRKQGLRHRLARGAARLIPTKKLREEAISEIGHREKLAEARRDARREAELTSAGELETFKIQQRQKRKKAYISGGGFLGAASRGIQGTAVAISKLPKPQTTPRTTATAVVTKGRKKARKAKKRIRKKVKVVKRPTISSSPAIPKIADLKFDF